MWVAGLPSMLSPDCAHPFAPQQARPGRPWGPFWPPAPPPEALSRGAPGAVLATSGVLNSPQEVAVGWGVVQA